MITARQRELLQFIDSRIRAEGVAPSYEEMRVELGLQSKSGVNRLVIAMEARGLVRRLPHKARAIEVLHVPGSDRGSVGFFPDERERAAATGTMRIPVMGSIGDGIPETLTRHFGGSISVPSGMLDDGEHFALEVRDTSLESRGIMPGDHVLIRRQDSAVDGDTVLASTQRTAYLRKMVRQAGTSMLAPPDRSGKPVQRDRVRLVGVMRGLVRKY